MKAGPGNGIMAPGDTWVSVTSVRGCLVQTREKPGQRKERDAVVAKEVCLVVV